MSKLNCHRVEATIALELTDRIPVMPIMSTFAMRHRGLTQAEAWANPEKALSAMIETYRDLEHCDMLPRTNLHWPMGVDNFNNAPARVKMPGRELPEDDLIQFDEIELFGRKDYDRIAALGWNGFWKEYYPEIGKKSMKEVGGKLRHLMNIYAQQVEKCKKQGIPVLIGCTIDSLMMAFSLCRTITQFTVDLFEVPEKVKKAMDASCDDLIQNALDTIEVSKIPLAWIVLERSSSQLYRMEIFEKFEWPYLQRYVDAFLSSGIIPWFHLDTDWTRNLPYFRKFPKGKCVVDLDSTTNIFKAKEILDGHTCISGDVPAGLLSLGTKEEVHDYCKNLIKTVGKGGGFFLTTGCECPIDAKFENVKTMVDSVLEG